MRAGGGRTNKYNVFIFFISVNMRRSQIYNLFPFFYENISFLDKSWWYSEPIAVNMSMVGSERNKSPIHKRWFC